ncbi:MAG: cytochrome c biogenesis protein ResB [Gemmataceae bacterium]|nr:cytochrome c biogenesis protein ResB [Gemmataceae bacterium]
MARKKARGDKAARSQETAVAEKRPTVPPPAPVADSSPTEPTAAVATAPALETAVVAESAVNGVSTNPAPRPPSPVQRRESKDVAVQRSFIEIAVIKIARWLGSLQVAVLGLTLFATVLALGTIVESWYTGKVAQDMIYKTWWFAALLGLLWVNIFFAAAKKWPWKKHQTGFLITHLGLLTMVFGGILNALGGTDALMVVTDTSNPTLQRRAGASQTSKSIIDRDSYLIQVQRATKRGHGDPKVFPFDPGSLSWGPDEYTEAKVPGLLRFLDFVAHPLPRSWSTDLGEGAKLEVLAYYPHARTERYRPWESKDRGTGFAAIKYELMSPMAGTLPGEWVVNDIQNVDDKWSVLPRGTGMVEMMGECESQGILNEFLKPPMVGKVGKKGELVLFFGDKQRFALDVDSLVGKGMKELENGWKVQITKAVPNITKPDENDAAPMFPYVEFRLTNKDGATADYGTIARFISPPRRADDRRVALPGLEGLQAFYHPADPRFDSKEDVRALLHFATGPDGKLYYRSYNSARIGSFEFETSGEAAKGENFYPVWQGMKWQFRVADFLPRAVSAPRYIPEDHRPGLERGDLLPVLRCKLSTPKGSKEFWLPLSDTAQQSTAVDVGEEQFSVAYNVKMQDLPFELKLLRGEETFDPGTQQKASYSSYIQLTDKRHNIVGEDRLITMNEPLEYDGYKFYQSGMEPMRRIVDQQTLRPVHRSTFTVGNDPGLWLKYLGSIMLAVGIGCMFYMKAYFITGKKARPATPNGEVA